MIMLFMVMFFCGVSKNADAKYKYVTERGVNRNTTVKGIFVVAKQYEEAGAYKYKIIMKKNEVKKTIAKNTTTDFTTNGKLFIILQLLKKYRRMKLKIVFINMILKQVNIRKLYRENLILYVVAVEGIYIVE